MNRISCSMSILALLVLPSSAWARLESPPAPAPAAETKARAALLREVEPIEVLEVPLDVTSLDASLRNACASLDELPLERWACLLAPGAECGRVVSWLDSMPEPPRIDDALEDLRDWEDESESTEQRLQDGTGAMFRLVARMHATSEVCHAVRDLSFTPAQLDEVRSMLYDGTLPRLLRLLNALTGRGSDVTAELEDVERFRADGDPEQALAKLREVIASLGEVQGGVGSSGTLGRLVGGRTQALVEGLGDFLLTRAKEEALVYLREAFVERLCGSDIEPFVRETCGVLSTADPTIPLRAIGRRLQRAMEDDLRRLPDVGLVLGSTYDAGFGYYATGLRVALALHRAARGGRDPLATLRSLHTAPAIDCETTTIEHIDDVPGVHECRETMGLLRSASALAYAVDQQQGGEADAFWVTTTLIAWEQREAAMPADVAAGSRFRPTKLAPAAFVRVGKPLAAVHHAVASLRETIKFVQGQLRDGIDPAQSHDMIVAASTTVRAMIDAGRAVRCAVDASKCPAAPLVATARPTGLLAMPSRRNAWLAAAPAAASGLDELLSAGRVLAMQRVAETVGDTDWASAAPAAMELIASYGEKLGEENWNELVRLVPVIIEISQSESSADVAATLEAAVPAGGFRSKYRQPMLAINGFLGFQLAGETYRAGPQDERVTTASMAMFAPVGLHVAGPVAVKDFRPWALGGLVSVLDLGTVTARRLGEEPVPDAVVDGQVVQTKVDELPPLDIRQLFSPGAYLTVGIRESPATLGVGLSYNPMLRQARVEGEEPDTLGVIRYGVFVAIDVTMFAFRLRRSR